MKTSRRGIRSFHDITRSDVDVRRPIVTLFSGGLDSTYLLHRLVQAGSTEVHALGVDVGGDEQPEQIRRIADQLGVRLHLVDGRAAFVEEFVKPAIAAHGVYLDTHPVSSSLSRPLIARTAVQVARELDAQMILHTANRSQNTLRRLNGALEQLGFQGYFGTPYDLDPVGREMKIKELRAIGLDEMAERSASGDSNLWCREFESGSLDDPENHAVPESYYRWTATRGTPDAEDLEVTFHAGTPVAVDGRELPLTDIIELLNRTVGAHGLGRHTGLEHLADGIKVLEVREMPAAWLLLASRRHLETAVLEAEALREKIHVEQIWVREALEGRWYGGLRAACQAFVTALVAPVTGTVRWRLAGSRTSTVSIVAADPKYVRSREDWEWAAIREEISHLGGAVNDGNGNGSTQW
ncbi:argininosuccinate synthase [Streptomyces luteolifulvus]|uniref:argininosuccinate synthase n=1 Tax=Streptomyces luteolifulvus TaxID=2615112 RepID=A0A6H9UPC4_9ACTN|nr:argininosuccinate synthase-related protein [Streptomyces luteolifulvus]KAB1140006.1 argininosuccinate synthase [Streptomyces luteolifulvus]